MTVDMPLDIIAFDPGRPSYRPYLRYSSDKSSKGMSLARQMGYDETSDEFISKEKVKLPLGPPLVDRAISAFRGKHVREGVLADFLKQVHNEQVPRGTVLGIDEWSRLTRMKYSKAEHLLSGLINAGIGIYVKRHETLYTEEAVNDETTGMATAMMAKFHLRAAYDESLRKSRYTRLTNRLKHEQFEKGGAVPTKQVPGWLEVVGGTYKDHVGAEVQRIVREIPGRVALVRCIFQMARTMGTWAIAKKLNDEWKAGDDRSAPFGTKRKRGSDGWYQGSVAVLLKNPAVCGWVVRIETDFDTGKPKKLPKDKWYKRFPEIISEDEFAEVQRIMRGRLSADYDKVGRKIGKGGRKGALVPNLFSGACVCGICGGPVMYVRVQNGTNKAKGQKWKFAYLRCRAAKIGKGCTGPSVNYHHVERAVLDELAAMPVEGLTRLAEQDSPEKAERVRLIAEMADLTERMDEFATAPRAERDAMRKYLAGWGQRKDKITARLRILDPIIEDQDRDDPHDHLMTVKKLRAIALTADGEDEASQQRRINARREMHTALLRVVERVVVTRLKTVNVTLKHGAGVIVVADGTAKRLGDVQAIRDHHPSDELEAVLRTLGPAAKGESYLDIPGPDEASRRFLRGA